MKKVLVILILFLTVISVPVVVCALVVEFFIVISHVDALTLLLPEIVSVSLNTAYAIVSENTDITAIHKIVDKTFLF